MGTHQNRKQPTTANADRARRPMNSGLSSILDTDQAPMIRPLKAVAAVRIRSGLPHRTPLVPGGFVHFQDHEIRDLDHTLTTGRAGMAPHESAEAGTWGRFAALRNGYFRARQRAHKPRPIAVTRRRNPTYSRRSAASGGRHLPGSICSDSHEHARGERTTFGTIARTMRQMCAFRGARRSAPNPIGRRPSARGGSQPLR